MAPGNSSGELSGKMKPPALNLQAPHKTGAYLMAPSPCPSSDADEGGVSLKKSPFGNGPVTGQSQASTNIVSGSATNTSSVPESLATGSNEATSSDQSSPTDGSPHHTHQGEQDYAEEVSEPGWQPQQEQEYQHQQNVQNQQQQQQSVHVGPIQMPRGRGGYHARGSRQGWGANYRGSNMPVSPSYANQNMNGRPGFHKQPRGRGGLGPRGRGGFEMPDGRQQFRSFSPYRYDGYNSPHNYQHGQMDPCEQSQGFDNGFSAPVQTMNMNNEHLSSCPSGYQNQNPGSNLTGGNHPQQPAVASTGFPINNGGPQTFPSREACSGKNKPRSRQSQRGSTTQLPQTPERGNSSINGQEWMTGPAQKTTFPIAPEQRPGNDMNGFNNTLDFAPQASSSAQPTGYRAGLPGSASDGSLMNPFNPAHHGLPSLTSTVHMTSESQQPITTSEAGDNSPPKANGNGKDAAPSNSSNNKTNIVVAHGTNNIINSTLYHPATKAKIWEPPTQEVIAGRSEELNRLVDPATGRPHPSLLLDPEFIPFEETLKRGKQCHTDSVCVIRNAPYDVRVADVTSILPKPLRLASKESIHITMDRNMGKTMDIYVELSGPDSAVVMKDHVDTAWLQSRPVRVGDRIVDVDVSSQEGLMRALFPRAACGWGYDAEPVFEGDGQGDDDGGSKTEDNDDGDDDGDDGGEKNNNEGGIIMVTTLQQQQHDNEWKGFVMEEELTMLVKFAEAPGRSAFAKNSPERPYECLLSTLVRLPWHHPGRITIHQRHYIYRATRDCLRCLDDVLSRSNPGHHHHPRLTRRLRQRLVTAAMLCPGFTVLQKEELGLACGMTRHQVMTEYGLPLHSGLWRHQYTISPRQKVPVDVTEYYIALIREETNRAVEDLPIRERTLILQRQQQGQQGQQQPQYWGHFWREVGFPSAGKKFDCLDLAEAHELEMGAVDRILRRALERGGNVGDERDV